MKSEWNKMFQFPFLFSCKFQGQLKIVILQKDVVALKAATNMVSCLSREQADKFYIRKYSDNT